VTKHNIAVFMGTRPEAIKLAPVVAALRGAGDFRCAVVATGQHKEMFRQVAETFGFAVDSDLDVMRPNQSLAGLTARLMEAIDGWLGSAQPDMALVEGDTTTVLVASLACFYRRVPIGHVEAGLRTGNIWSPFPEEVNRRLATPLVALHFAPTEVARTALLCEGVAEDIISVTGNTVIDALRMEVATQKGDATLRARIDEELGTLLGADWMQVPMVLITGHRRENFGDGIAQICQAIATLAQNFPDHQFVYPVHLNPNVLEHVSRLLGKLANVRLIAPQGYRNFVALLTRCRLVLTDSGGVQEEAPSLGKPVLVMRDTTERPEGVAAGTAILTGPNAPAIVEHATRVLTDEAAYRSMAAARNPYGDGHAAERIVERIGCYFAARAFEAPSLAPARGAPELVVPRVLVACGNRDQHQGEEDRYGGQGGTRCRGASEPPACQVGRHALGPVGPG
jgi:UDP-N-acetylglucosamine 2-epimerase (non-hydrolysing)